MNARKSWIIAFIIVIIGGIAFVYISGLKQPPRQAPKKSLVMVPYFTIQNSSIPLVVSGSGQVRAKNRIDLFSEVNGVLLRQEKDFRAGMSFKKGDILVSIDDTEQLANLYAQRSEFQNLITSLIPDIKLEFPEEAQKWDDYLNSIEITRPVPAIPATLSDKEKYFVTGRKVYTTFYNIQNLEARLQKYRLIAPFDGVVTESLINPGALVRSGQKLGSFSNTGLLEIEVAIPAADIAYLKTGNTAHLHLKGQNSTWEGIVSRINPAIDLNTQTVSVFIESTDEGLREGMFITADIQCGDLNDVVEIPRNLLVNNEWVYFIQKDSTLQRLDINPIRFQENTVIADKLQNGTKILAKNISGSFIGMKIIPVSE